MFVFYGGRFPSSSPLSVQETATLFFHGRFIVSKKG